jgi:hypothetical protein
VLDHDDGDIATSQVLLVAQIHIGRDEDVETLCLGRSQEFAIGQSSPALFERGPYLVSL